MMEQLAFFDPSIEDRFQRFHAANPHVYELLVQYAREAKAAGITRIGVRVLWERMRWQLMVATVRDDGDFKLNDHFHSRYARLIMEQEPDLAGIFELRKLRAA